MPRRSEFQATDGQAITFWRWPQSQSRPMLHWAHATGFHGRLYRPLLDDIQAECNVLAWDMRGHGFSANAAEASTFRGWETYYQDLTTLLDHLDTPIWLAGHSIGGTASIMAAARRPEKVLGLILAEPVIMDRKQGLEMWLAKRLRRSQRLALAAGAARRRAVFESHEAAVNHYRGRGIFKTWPDTWLEAYVRFAFMDHGDHIRLACSPEWESTTFAQTEHNPWPGIRKLRCPVVALSGDRGSTFSLAARERLQTLLPSADVKVIEDTTHFLPMEKSDTVRAAIHRLVSQK